MSLGFTRLNLSSPVVVSCTVAFNIDEYFV